MASPTTSDVHLDAALSSIATAYRNQDEALIASEVFPRVPVQKQSDKYFIWDKEYWLTIHVQPRAPGDLYPEGLLKLSSGTYYAELFHLAYPIADEDRANEDPAVQLERTAAEWLSHQFALHREDKLASDIFKTSVWDTDVTLSGINQWSDFTNSDPIKDVDTAHATIQQNTGVRGNTLIVGQQVHDKLKEHPKLLDKYKHTGIGILSPEQVRDSLGLTRYLVGGAVKITSNVEAASITSAYVWGKSALLLYRPENAGLRVPSAGYTFVWAGLPGGGGFDVPITVVREDSRDRDIVRGRHAFDHKVTGTDLGYFISAAVA